MMLQLKNTFLPVNSAVPAVVVALLSAYEQMIRKSWSGFLLGLGACKSIHAAIDPLSSSIAFPLIEPFTFSLDQVPNPWTFKSPDPFE